jgi:tetratricopeptide (TPR) repeat protein
MILVISLLTAHAAELAPDVALAEQYFVDDNTDGALATLDTYLKTNPNDPEAIWRKARSMYERGEVTALTMTAEQRIPVYEEISALGKRAAELAPGYGPALHWQGTGLGRKGTAQGVFQSLWLADDIEGIWLSALKDTKTVYLAADGGSSWPGDTYYALGQFYRLVPDWALVQLLVGTKGDIDKSISYHRLAMKQTPNRVEIAKELGVSLLCKGVRDNDSAATTEGRVWLGKAAKMASVKRTDTIDKEQIPVILQREADACGYSRDGWEDLSREAYEKQK